MRDYVRTMCDEVWPACARVGEAVEKWPQGAGWERTGFWLAHGRTLQETLDQDPVKLGRYDRAMGAMSNDRSFSVEHVVEGYDWAALGQATVVDMGGGVGTVSKELAKAFPLLDFIVQDRQEVIEHASLDATLKERVRYMEHDIFREQPIKDAAVYFIRRVLMEKNNEQCVDFLKALIPALKLGAVVLIQDPMVPNPGTCPSWQERRFRESDVAAYSLINHCPREEEEWRDIVLRAGEGFEYKGVSMAENSNTAFVEAVWRGERGSQV
ncbi:uncharacterized protein LTR77_004708 [Saxophila tyrrhenica]|uniref:O-methyltransferase C-terminal domain-containing protein n=1 Tax=Saxophila tyrrhenica TaxID=1690608 RepID=A0AAV9PA68_9PEZI|nr:hypothetical protein LTR77_004708 [Saxophila tyrrhenica]